MCSCTHKIASFACYTNATLYTLFLYVSHNTFSKAVYYNDLRVLYAKYRIRKSKRTLHSGTVVSPIASQQEGHELKSTSQLGPFCVEFACSLHACVGSFPLPFDLCVSVSPERCL